MTESQKPKSKLDTGWTRALTNGASPDAAAMRDHLEIVHGENAGFTESCAAACCDAEGRNSYDWLAEAVGDAGTGHILDLACGSGVLLEQLERRYPAARLTGVDMSADELALAALRVPRPRVSLRRAMAQDLDFLPTGSVNAVLCHWALTLMHPVEPVLQEIGRVLATGGLFAAIVDGPMDSAPGYRAVNDLIFDHVARAYPAYGTTDLGDPRIRDHEALTQLLGTQFSGARVTVEPNIVSMTASPAILAREAARFFYSVFVLEDAERTALLTDLTTLFTAQGPEATFHMPINRVIVAI
ncbi:MAG: class I SAM-dependent methyltransferase [Pacificimonas sp.]